MKTIFGLDDLSPSCPEGDGMVWSSLVALTSVGAEVSVSPDEVESVGLLVLQEARRRLETVTPLVLRKSRLENDFTFHASFQI